MATYMKFEGTKQGWIKGGATAAGWEGYIILDSLEFGLGHPIDANTHLAIGRKVARPLVVTKPVDNASPLLINCSNNNEVAKTVTIAYSRTGIDQKHSTYLTIVLKNATIQDFNFASSGEASSVERIMLVYTNLEFTWADGGIVGTVDAVAQT